MSGARGADLVTEQELVEWASETITRSQPIDAAGEIVNRAIEWAFSQEPEPGPYAEAFRERVCPVPEFPGIKNRQEDQA